MRMVQVASTALFLLGIVGAYAALLGWRDGVFLMLAWALITIAWHLTVGVYGYRRVMRHEWPHVAPLTDDDWDD
jgi:hypothetical protein